MAQFTRTDTGDAPTSYPAPTYSAIVNMCQAVYRDSTSDAPLIIPRQVAICRPIQETGFNTNYRGINVIAERSQRYNALQSKATVLVNVCYQVYVDIINNPPYKDNPAHAYQSIFNRRLKGQFFYTIPYLGKRDFTSDYVGFFRPETLVCKDINLTIPSMFKTRYPKVSFLQDVKIVDGILTYA